MDSQQQTRTVVHKLAKQYERIADDLRAKIRAGEHLPGDRIPTEDALKTHYKVSAPTIRHAVGVLEAEGLVQRQHGRGTFVRKPRAKVQRTAERYQWEKDRVKLSDEERRTTGATERDTGRDMSALEFYAAYDSVFANADLAAVFDVSEGTKLLHRVYRTRLKTEDAPLSLIDSYIVHDVAARNPDLLLADNEPWPGGTQHQLYTIGIELDHIREELTARPPTVDEAQQLELSAGTAVIALRKISVATTGDVVEVSDVVLPGDRTVAVYTTQLTRWDD
ncbi:GntR family transcriptional regulator [Haloechinothrix salitolerans]|uniref:GntR family transcriptional regulator n=1 Tax=Haloechinothrix salitolerans TaxID=926830 RepID=A0ABW2BUW6_9PSEU